MQLPSNKNKILQSRQMSLEKNVKIRNLLYLIQNGNHLNLVLSLKIEKQIDFDGPIYDEKS